MGGSSKGVRCSSTHFQGVPVAANRMASWYLFKEVDVIRVKTVRDDTSITTPSPQVHVHVDVINQQRMPSLDLVEVIDRQRQILTAGGVQTKWRPGSY